MTDHELRTRISELIGRHIRVARREVDYRTKKPMLVIETDSDGFSFDDMCEISLHYGTTNLNFESEDREGGHCDTCAHNYSVSVLYIRDFVES